MFSNDTQYSSITNHGNDAILFPPQPPASNDTKTKINNNIILIGCLNTSPYSVITNRRYYI